MVKTWLGIPPINTHDWAPNLTINEWWTMISCKAFSNRKGLE
jgi:hypothetical protein